MENPPLTQKRIQQLQRTLLAWFAENRRDLPWRREPTPYQVWVSEIMLQQTRVDVVRDYYLRWMKRLPTIEALAHAEESDVLLLWQGLGYYSRARRLLEGARFLVREKGGELPADPEELLSVPGIGPYSAGAIASIAHSRRAPLVDGNVIRVLTRLFGLGGDPAKSPLKQRLWELADTLVPEEEPGEFNQALMELGALVCTPKSPTCLICPWQKECRAHAQGEATRYPEKPAARAATEVTILVLIFQHRGRYALEQLSEDARWWAGLSTFPSLELTRETGGAPSAYWERASMRVSLGALGSAEEFESSLLSLLRVTGAEGARIERSRELPPLKHQVTRFKISLRPWIVELSGERPQWEGHAWVTARELHERALPAPHKKLASALLEEGTSPRSRPRASR